MKVIRTRAMRTLGSICLSLALSLSLGAAAASAKTQQGGWYYFIQGDSAPMLRGWSHPTQPGLPAGWTIHNGVLYKGGPVDDLQSVRTYKDFDLRLEWKIGKEGNSGIFYRATHQYDEIYWTGPEYQLLDDQNAPDGKQRITAAGSVYAMYPAPAGIVHPYGHWNTARIVVRGTHVTYWMNGQRIVDYDFGSPDWTKRVAGSKFSAYPGYGRAPVGIVGLQGNHPGSIAIRNMRIKVLP